MNVRTAFTVSYRALRTAIPRTKASDADTHGQVETRCCERKATEAPMIFVLMSAVKPSSRRTAYSSGNKRNSMRPRLLIALFAGLVMFSATLHAQSRITSVEPLTAKAGDTVNATGEEIDNANVDTLYLTDGTNDFKCQICA